MGRTDIYGNLKIEENNGVLIAKFKKYEPLLRSFEEGVNEGVSSGNKATV